MIENIVYTPHFDFFQLTNTSHANMLELNRQLGVGVGGKLQVLAQTLLEPIRSHINSIVVVDCGYRCPVLNKLVNGAVNSQHLMGEAADITCPSYDLDTLFEWIWKTSGLKYGQVINERHNTSHWIHISLGVGYRSIEKCMEALTFDGSSYIKVN